MAENFISRLLNLHSDRAHRVDPTTPATPTPELFRKVLSSKRWTRNCQGLAHFSPSSVKPWIYFPHPFPLFSTYSLLSNSRPTTTTMLIMRMFLTWNRRNEIHGQIFMQPIILHGFVERGQGVVARVGIRMEISPFHSLLGYKLGKTRKTRSGIATVQLFWERERANDANGRFPLEMDALEGTWIVPSELDFPSFTITFSPPDRSSWACDFRLSLEKFSRLYRNWKTKLNIGISRKHLAINVQLFLYYFFACQISIFHNFPSPQATQSDLTVADVLYRTTATIYVQDVYIYGFERPHVYKRANLKGEKSRGAMLNLFLI